jgi:hypothetical protein
MSTPMQAPTMQDLYLEILRRSRVNSFDGQRVYDDLMADRTVWDSAYPVRESGGNNVTLRDLASDGHDVDTLYIRTTEERLSALTKLASGWRPDEFDAEQDAYADKGTLIVRVWWD